MQALDTMAGAVSRFLGMDLLPDGSVRVHGLEAPKRTVDLVAPFGPVAHTLQLLRDRPDDLVAFYQEYSRRVSTLGRRAESFDGQLEAFQGAAQVVPGNVRPRLKRVV